jgi:hypothetical protein
VGKGTFDTYEYEHWNEWIWNIEYETMKPVKVILKRKERIMEVISHARL